jgi:hypothetical protein
MIVSTDAERAFGKTQCPFMIKPSRNETQKVCTAAQHRSYIIHSQHHTEWGRIKSFSPKIWNKT